MRLGGSTTKGPPREAAPGFPDSAPFFVLGGPNAPVARIQPEQARQAAATPRCSMEARAFTLKAWTTGALLVVVAALLVVGVVSGTPIRHVLQVVPGVLLLAAGPHRRPWAACAATAVFALWLFFMSLIWLYLLGLAQIVTGRFTPVEVVLTVVIGVAALVGLVAGCRVREMPARATRVAVFLLSAAAQIGVVWLSVQPSFANR